MRGCSRREPCSRRSAPHRFCAPWIDALGREHIGLTNLTVPTLVIGSAKDRLLPMVSSRHIARMAPNLASFVELSGGHCAIVERPDEVNKHLRMLIESVTEDQRATS
jgi:pimeloyl-ACP methyl ester carboxylesterase